VNFFDDMHTVRESQKAIIHGGGGGGGGGGDGEQTNEKTAAFANELKNCNDQLEPQFGCLKGGKLKTYRQWARETQRNCKPETPNIHININTTPPPAQTQTQPPFSTDDSNTNNATTVSGGGGSAAAAVAATATAELVAKTNRKLSRTLKQVFHLGKSKYHPKVGVLIPDHDLRQRIQQEAYSLQRESIEDIRKFLQRKGLIKVGCVAPDHILRKMFESAKLIGADIVNHNPDTLLYNYLKENKH
jgi:hypothetical protein